MTKHTKYQFPSAFGNEIERPLRRDVIASMKRRSRISSTIRIVVAGVVLGLLAALAFRAVMPIVSAAPAPEQVVATVDGEEVSLVTLCARYRSDELMSGQKMEQATARMCGF